MYDGNVGRRLLSLAEAATYLDLSIHTLRKLLYEGELRYVQRVRSGKILLEQKELDSFIDRHSHKHNPAPWNKIN